MLEAKTAVVTGGASGLGEATCRLMVAEGAHVIVADIQDDKGEAKVVTQGTRVRAATGAAMSATLSATNTSGHQFSTS